MKWQGWGGSGSPIRNRRKESESDEGEVDVENNDILIPNNSLTTIEAKQPNLLGNLHHAKLQRGEQQSEVQVLVHKITIKDVKTQTAMIKEMQECINTQKVANFSPYILRYVGITQEGGDTVNVITEKYNYSLAGLLRPKNGTVMPPLITRITWARDIARGMQCLCRLKPNFSHNHLNTAQIKVSYLLKSTFKLKIQCLPSHPF